MTDVQYLFEFQILTDTAKEARAFMDDVKAQDVVIETWNFSPIEGDTEIEECYGFGLTHYKPKLLKRIADFMDIRLVYAERSQ
jgi:hypothetical protein